MNLEQVMKSHELNFDIMLCNLDFLLNQDDRPAYNEHALKTMKDSTWDTAIYDNLGPALSELEANNESKIEKIYTDKFKERLELWK